MIKNPILKQIGKNQNRDFRDTKTKSDKKLCLEDLIEYLKYQPQSNILNPIINQNQDQQIIENNNNLEPNLGEFINLNLEPLSDLNKIFKNFKFKRYGVIKSCYGKLKFYSNLSFLSSLMICINDSFIYLDEDAQVEYLKCIKEYIYDSFNLTFFGSNNYKELTKEFNFDRETISKNLYNFELSRNEICVISDLFHINIFLADIARNKLFFTGHKFIPFKKNIFLLKKPDGFFEPLSLDNKFYINDDNFINYILENKNNIELFYKYEKQPIFSIHTEPLDKYLKVYEVKLDIKNKIIERQLINISRSKSKKLGIEPVIEPIIEPVIEPIIEPVIEPIIEPIIEPVIKYNKKDLDKMKLNELIAIANNLNISIDYADKNNKIKKKTKALLIEEIIIK